MTLRLYDSYSKELRVVDPAGGRPLGVYSCGPTVYSYLHVGNARPFWIAMVLKRHAARRGHAVLLVVNVTDVDDKAFQAAAREGRSSRELARFYTEAYVADTSALGLGRPDVEPLVSNSMPAIIALVGQLVERGLAYEAAGDVYFRVAAFPGYGALSGQQLEHLLEEGRVEPGEGKESPLDFALWKAQKPGEDAAWESPWGAGRPGWHIECSAMALEHLPHGVDVHGGGLDLIFPHHENERAQAEGAGQRPFVGTWLHNGMLRFTGDKMSKSTGNLARLRDALDEWGPEVLLYLFASAHYRSPQDYTELVLRQSQGACERIADAIRGARRHAASGADGLDAGDALLRETVKAAAAAFDAALDDDLATPQALAAVHEIVRNVNVAIRSGRVSAGAVGGALADLRSCLDVLGLAALGAEVEDELPEAVRGLVAERERARAARDFGRADELRAELGAAGFTVRDTAAGAEVVRRTPGTRAG